MSVLLVSWVLVLKYFIRINIRPTVSYWQDKRFFLITVQNTKKIQRKINKCTTSIVVLKFIVDFSYKKDISQNILM